MTLMTNESFIIYINYFLLGEANKINGMHFKPSLVVFHSANQSNARFLRVLVGG